MWDQVAQVWSGLGQADPHWSVLTEDRYRRAALDEAALAVFRASGVGEVRRLNAWLHRAGWSLRPDAVCAEYGCGVSRITAPLARRFGGSSGPTSRPGGCTFFQVPTYAAGYRYDPAHATPAGEMEMHVLPQRQILHLAHEAGLTVAEIQPD